MDAWLIVVIAICVAALIAFVVQRVVRAHQKQVSAGREELEKGRVKPGEEVIVTKVDGLKLRVVKKEIEEVNK